MRRFLSSKSFSCLFFVSVLVLGVATFPSRALAATFTVNSTIDDVDVSPGDGICQTTNIGECTMRAAIEESNSFSGTDTVLMPMGTYLFSLAGTITISDSAIITGAGQSLTFIEQGVFFVTTPGTLSMSQLTIQNGGGIDNDNGADLTFSNVTISNNTGSGIRNSADGSSTTLTNSIISNNAGFGITSQGLFSPIFATNTNIDGNGQGGIYAASGVSTVSLTNSTVSNNIGIGVSLEASRVNLNDATVTGNSGYGIQTMAGSGTDIIVNSDISNNSGGGVSSGGSALSISDTTITGNTSNNPGGGIIAGGTTTLTNVLINNNHAFYSGGIYNGGGTLTMTDTTVASNSADLLSGSVFNDGLGTMTIERSAISGNTDGGVANNGTLFVTNSTLSGNSGIAAIHNANTATVLNSTIAFNNSSEGGIWHETLLTLKNSIIANNTVLDCNGFGTITSDGNNIDSDGTCNLTGSGDQPNTNPLLGPLQDNGGPTYTHALLTGSPAIDTGNNTGCPSTDQRDTIRPADGNGDSIEVCDIGAFELQLPAPESIILELLEDLPALNHIPIGKLPKLPPQARH